MESFDQAHISSSLLEAQPPCLNFKATFTPQVFMPNFVFCFFKFYLYLGFFDSVFPFSFLSGSALITLLTRFWPETPWMLKHGFAHEHIFKMDVNKMLHWRKMRQKGPQKLNHVFRRRRRSRAHVVAMIAATSAHRKSGCMWELMIRDQNQVACVWKCKCSPRVQNSALVRPQGLRYLLWFQDLHTLVKSHSSTKNSGYWWWKFPKTYQ